MTVMVILAKGAALPDRAEIAGGWITLRRASASLWSECCRVVVSVLDGLAVAIDLADAMVFGTPILR